MNKEQNTNIAKNPKAGKDYSPKSGTDYSPKAGKDYSPKPEVQPEPAKEVVPQTEAPKVPLAKIDPVKMAVPADAVTQNANGEIELSPDYIEKKDQKRPVNSDKLQQQSGSEAEELFTAKRKKPTNEEKEYMSDIDAVWNDTGSTRQRAVTFLILALLLSFIAWASWATIDELTRGQGQVIASSGTQVITHLEGGILSDILVTEGVIVEEGQILARVENVAAESVYRDTQTKIYELTATIIRLEAELNDTQLQYSPELISAAPNIVELQTQVYNTRRRQFLSEIDVLDTQSQQAHYELDDMEKKHRTTTEALSLASRRLDLSRPMVAQGLYAEVDFLNLQQEIVNLRGELDSLENNISKAEIVVQESELKKNLFKSEYNSRIIEEINKITSERNSLEKNLTTGSDRVVRTEIRSPMRGVVNQIVLNTKGGAVKPGEPIMEVVPLDDTLLIEAKISPADIGFIYPNQKAVVKLTAYDFSIFGGLEAKVEQISADTIQGQGQQANEYFYLVKLRTTENSLEYRGETLPIIPGMIASVDIITGKKTIMQYLLKPILKAKDNALRER